jgi:hypothetical protein
LRSKNKTQKENSVKKNKQFVDEDDDDDEDDEDEEEWDRRD